MEGTIKIRGARENNLKNVSLEIPKYKLVVMTGPSGSGKSTLAMDTRSGSASGSTWNPWAWCRTRSASRRWIRLKDYPRQSAWDSTLRTGTRDPPSER